MNNYVELNEELEEIERYFGFFGIHKLNAKFQNEFEELFWNLYFEKFPKRKKRFELTLKFQLEHKELLDSAREQLKPKAIQFLTDLKLRKRELLQLFSTVTLPLPTIERFEIRSVSKANYSTQGFGAERYAIGSLEPYVIMLNQHNYNAEIVDTSFGNRLHWTIFANCEKWVLTAIMLRLENNEYNSIVENANSKNCTNQKVYDNEAIVANWKF